MGERWKHMGASSGEIDTCFKTATCIYSENKKIYEVPNGSWNPDKQLNLDMMFMSKDCGCEKCVEKRKEKLKLKRALERVQDSDGLRAMGW